MIPYTVYKQNGQITRTGYCSSQDELQLQPRDGESVIEGHYADDKYYYDNGFVEIPARPGSYYVFNYDTKQWQLNETIALVMNRSKRNQLLASSDWTQMPDVTIPNKTEWATYRQQLRDMTEQQLIAGDFPTTPQ